jgi:hypothetical protein
MMSEQERKQFEFYWSAENTICRYQDITIRELEYENQDLTKEVQKLKNELQALKRENRVLKGLPEEEPEPEPEPAEILETETETEPEDESWKPVRCIGGQNYYLEKDEELETIDYTGGLFVSDEYLFEEYKNRESGYNGRMMDLDEEPIEGGEPLSDEEIDDEPKRFQTNKIPGHKPEFKSIRLYPLPIYPVPVPTLEEQEQAVTINKEEFYDMEEEVLEVER